MSYLHLRAVQALRIVLFGEAISAMLKEVASGKEQKRPRNDIYNGIIP
jgi:hypothetical protein